MSVIGLDGETIVDQIVTVSTDPQGIVTYEMPAGHSFSVPITGPNSLPLRSYSERIAGGKKTVTASYVPASASRRGSPPVGTVNRSSGGTAQEIPIRLHPLCSNPENPDEPPIINGVAKPGVESYLVPGVIYTRSEVLNSAIWTEANLISGLGALSAPTGITGASANKWLKVARDVSETGDGTTITDTWQYAPDGWDTDIY